MYLLSDYGYDYYEFCTPIAVSKSSASLEIRAKEHSRQRRVEVLPTDDQVDELQLREVHHYRIEKIEEVE